MALLNVEQLSVCFSKNNSLFYAVDHISYQVKENQVLGIVGESGSGKSVSSLAIMGLIDYPGDVIAEKLEFDSYDLNHISIKKRRQLLGCKIAMIFQDPMTSLNPCFTIGFQIIETLKVHQHFSKNICRQHAIDLLNKVGISDPESRLNMYPHQLSGGMNQRVMIAIAIACKPKLLIADEPTTAVDVTMQAQIIDLLLNLHQQEKMALIFISHDLSLVAEVAQDIIVMYAGQIVESGKVVDILEKPRHPYTQALLRSLPEFSFNKRLFSLPGLVPSVGERPIGCILNPRCPYVINRCRYEEPKIYQIDSNKTKCHFPLDNFGKPNYKFPKNELE